jgi:hypothetical protein
MKQVIQLDANGYFSGFATTDESPLEPGVFLIPGGCIETAAPTVPEGQCAKWDGAWLFEDIPQPVAASVQELEPVALTYAQKRAAEYPPMADYLDAVVKNDQAQIDAYVTACLAVKAKYPKEQPA